jgi:hypothetical protein
MSAFPVRTEWTTSRKFTASRAGAQGNSLIGCMTSRSEAPSKFQVPSFKVGRTFVGNPTTALCVN